METQQQFNVPLEVKALSTREFEGHGAVFRNVDYGGDVIVPGAFTKTLADHRALGTWPSMYWMHQKDQVPGVWQEIREDAKGLYVKGEIVDTALGRDVHTLLTKKAVRGLSIGYRPLDWGYDKDGNRQLKAVHLWEVSITSMQMNPLAQVEAVKARLTAEGIYVPSAREVEHWLRDKGCSKAVARQMCARLLEDAADDPEAGGKPGTDDEDAKQVLESLSRLTARWDAGDVRGDAKEQDVLKSLEKYTAALSR